MRRPSFRLPLALIALATLATFAPSTHAARPATLPSGFTRVLVASGLNLPTSMAFRARQIFVTEKDSGKVRIVTKNGTIRPTPYVTLHVTNDGERGLLGIALDPNYASGSRYVYLFYVTGPGALNYTGSPKIRVSRFTTVNGVGTNETILLETTSESGYHNGGDIHFGFDGKLYIAIGENHSGGEAQKLSTRHGKILRINSDGSYPADNPFYANGGVARSIYAYGFRNPWRFTLRNSNQSYIVADVGQNTWEEIDSLQRGGNFGWNLYEGPCPSSNLSCNPALTNYNGTIAPIHYYNHNTGTETGNVVIGGAFAENSNYPAPYNGAYFYGDLGGDWVHVLTLDSNNNVTGGPFTFDNNISSPVDFETRLGGSIFVLSHNGGAIYKYVYTP